MSELAAPGAVALVVPGRGVAARASRPSPAALRAVRGASPATSAAAWSPTTRTTRPPPRDAFEVLHYIAGKRLRRRPADRRRRDQRAARRPPAAGRAGPRARRAAGRHRARPARAGLRRAQRRPRRTATSAPASSAASATSCAARCAASARRASARSTSCAASRRSPPRPIVRERLLNDFRHEHGPFDVIGDVHGCRAELETLLDRARLRAGPRRPGPAGRRRPPEGRTAVFVGDLVDRGPDTPGVLRLVMGMVAAGHALCVPGNHENKLVRALQGRKVQVTHGLAETARPSSPREPAEFREPGASSSATTWSRTSSSTTAGSSSRTPGSRRPTTAARRAGCAASRCTATPPARPTSSACRCATRGPTTTAAGRWCSTGTRRRRSRSGSTTRMCLDTGCVFGGRLTALRYPERELVSVPAERVWYEPVKPFPTPPSCAPAGRRERDALDITDVLGKRGRRDPPPRPGHRAGGERRRRAGGDEPLRARPALAALPAADHGAGATSTRTATCSSTRPRRSPPTARTASRR